MQVDIQPDVRDIAAQLGGGVPYALKAVSGRLADDPDLGLPSGLPGILSVTVDGDMFENCPDLSVGYLREPDRIEIRFLRAVPSTEPSEDDSTGPARDDSAESSPDDPTGLFGGDPEQERSEYPATAALRAREVADAWQRITAWLRSNAPDSYAALRVGARPAAIASLEVELGIPIPVELRVLWTLTAADDGVDGRGCLPGNMALMNLDAIAARYRLKTVAQTHQDALDFNRPAEERITVWEAARIPVIALGPSDSTAGLYLDTATGYLGSWSRYHEPSDGQLDTLVTYLEETADMLEAPALAVRDKPGLIGGTLVWLSSIDPEQESRWQPVTG